jgi:predicted O-methyltransferase YrrM
MTYPAIAFLENRDFRERRVLEWGSGQSTFWWAVRAQHVVSYESDTEWFESVRRRAPANVLVRLVSNDLHDLPADFAGQRFDVVVVDGLDRLRCAEKSLDLLVDDGVLVLDDAEQPWSVDSNGHYPIIELMRSHNFQRVDFFGFAPAVIRRHCTSLFFRDRCFLFEGLAQPTDVDHL